MIADDATQRSSLNMACVPGIVPAMAFPALRNVEPKPIEHEGNLLVCLLDPEGFVEQPAVMSPHAFFVASLLNGRQRAPRPAESIAVVLARYHGGARDCHLASETGLSCLQRCNKEDLAGFRLNRVSEANVSYRKKEVAKTPEFWND